MVSWLEDLAQLALMIFNFLGLYHNSLDGNGVLHSLPLPFGSMARTDDLIV